LASSTLEPIKHRDGTPQRRQELFEDAVAVITRDYPRPLQIDDVGRAVAASRRQLQRVFAEVGDTSFREMLQTTRMTEARRLLERDGIRIGEVARAVGYHQPAQFTKAFRRAVGMAPTEFRSLAKGSPGSDPVWLGREFRSPARLRSGS
jgi:AraC family transcriptional regulator of adaptative response / methylphosphotriester-DNA alkyltransferase methyltransferase